MAEMTSERGWSIYFFDIIKVISSKSKDPNTKIGCLIVGPDHEIRSTGYNSFPRGINDDIPERKIRPEKYSWFEHAERNAIYNAARVGIPLKGCCIYQPGLPCNDCARGIIQSGINKLVYDKNDWDKYAALQDRVKNNSWFWQTEKSLIMLAEAGVEVIAMEL